MSLGLWLGQLWLTTAALQARRLTPPFAYFPVYLRTVVILLLLALVCRVAVVLLVKTRRRRWREAISPLRLAMDLAWIAAAQGMLAHTYTWTKLMVPALHAASYDALFARWDRMLLRGVDPNVLVVALLRDGPAFIAHGIDALYGTFVKFALIFAAWFSTDLDRGRRIGFSIGFSLLWLWGLWGYVAFPAVGPAFVAEGLWQQVRDIMPTSVADQALLAQNYDAVQRVLAGERVPLQPVYGVAAMPSLHVATPMLYFLWAVLHGSKLRAPFLLVLLGMFVGSLASGWHYAVDGLAGAALAGAAAWVAWRVERSLRAGAAETKPA